MKLSTDTSFASGTIASVLAGSIATIAAYIFAAYGTDLPAPVIAAGTSLISVTLTFILPSKIQK